MKKSSSLESMGSIATGIPKLQIYLIITFIIFLILVIIAGRILYDLNNSGCQTDAHLLNAKKWDKYFLAICTTFMGLSLIAFIGLFFVEF